MCRCVTYRQGVVVDLAVLCLMVGLDDLKVFYNEVGSVIL